MSVGLKKVPQMDQLPVQCVACGGNPVDEEGDPQWAIDLGTDINYGDHAYLCCECATVVAGLCGWVAPETYQHEVDAYRAIREELEKTNAKLQKYREKVDAIKIVKEKV